MSLSDSFNQNCAASKTSDSVISIGNRVSFFHYDFAQRVVTTENGSIAPFSQMDREVLTLVRERLIKLGGKPPELSSDAPAPDPVKSSPKQFNL